MGFDSLYIYGVVAVVAFAAIIVPILLWISAPYGRHRRGGWGPTIPARLAWVVMESPSVLLFLWVYFQGAVSLRIVPLLLLFLWQVHYLQRTFIFPFLMRMKGKRDPVLTVVMALVFNSINAFINAYIISTSPLTAQLSWLWDPRFLIGLSFFVVGFVINRKSDAILRNLRKPGESGYKIPRGGLYRYVSCPNYFGELIEWAGWAVATWSLGGLAFLIFTAANLIPRARSHHRWYRETFDDYPAQRKVVIPGIY